MHQMEEINCHMQTAKKKKNSTSAECHKNAHSQQVDLLYRKSKREKIMSSKSTTLSGMKKNDCAFHK